MDAFPSDPPASVRADLAALRVVLDASPIPPKTLDRNLVIGTWNVRAFGKVLPKWASADGDSPRRNLRDILCLAEIVSRALRLEAPAPPAGKRRNPMKPTRTLVVTIAMATVLVAMLPTATLAAKPGPTSSVVDISSTARGAEVAQETADRFTAEGDPTSASDLRVYQYSDGSILAVQRTASASLSVGSAADGSPNASLDVGASLASGGDSSAKMAGVQDVELAASSIWDPRENGCLASLYVQSARLDSCYTIFKLTNDGNTNRSYWALRQKGTAFEYESGLHHAYVSGQRTSGTASQTWVDWEPDQEHSGSVDQCDTMNLGVSYIVVLTYSQTACEQWYYDKSCNTCSPWLQSTWDCGCWFAGIGGIHTPPTPRSRAIAYQFIVSMGNSQTPQFRLGLGLEA